MIKKLRVAVDHGNRNMKTCNHVFTTGLTEMDKKPARGEIYLQYQDKYYTLSERRIPYQRDKTSDSRFFVLTLFAMVKWRMKGITFVFGDRQGVHGAYVKLDLFLHLYSHLTHK